jgi:hypothetical protein
MKRILIFLAVAMALFGCAPTATQQMDLYGTAVVAQQQAQVSGLMLTGTAQAPIVHITETSAAFAMEQTYAQATAQSGQMTQMAQMTATAQSWTPTPNATMTAVFAMSYAEATKIANDTEINNMKRERQRLSNQFWAVILPIFLLTILLVLGFVGISYARQHLHKVHKGENGDKPLIENVVTGEWTDMDTNPNYSHKDTSLAEQMFTQWLERKYGFKPKFPQITAERQDKVKERDQIIDLRTRAAHLPKRLVDAQSTKFLPAPMNTLPSGDDNFLLPAWEIINGWDGKGIPYYTSRGLEMIDIEQYPHLSAIGMTGMGKSRRFFRPLIACALAAGHRVVIIGKSADYWPFEGHPNATVLKVNKITEPEQALRYASILEAIVAEMNRRDDVLTASRKSTWTHAGNSRTFIVLDELGNALRLMDRDSSNQSRIWVEGLVSEGRKAGFNLVLANQRATGMASILSQTGKAIFRVERDEERAHRSLLGASELRDGYFLAKFGDPKLAGAFEPTDEELKAFLASRPVSKLEDDDWIDGQLIEPKQVTVKSDAVFHLAEARRLAEEEIRILDLYAEGKSPTAIVYAVWPKSGSLFNEHMERVKAVIATTTTTSTTSSLKMPDFGGISG